MQGVMLDIVVSDRCVLYCAMLELFLRKSLLYISSYSFIMFCIIHSLFNYIHYMPLPSTLPTCIIFYIVSLYYSLHDYIHYCRYNIASIIALYIYLVIYPCYLCPCSFCIHFVSFSLYIIYCVLLLYMILFVFLFCGLFWKIKSDDLSWFVLFILVILLIKYRWSYIIHTFEICQEMFAIYYWFMKLNHYTIITIKERTRHDGLLSSDPIRSKHRSIQSWHSVSRYIAISCILIILFYFFFLLWKQHQKTSKTLHLYHKQHWKNGLILCYFLIKHIF